MNINTIRQALSIITDGAFEIRVISKYLSSGIFDNIDTACKAIEEGYTEGTYCVTLNQLSVTKVTSLVTNKFSVVKKNNNCCINDTLIDNINWLFIDLDPVRPAKTSSTDEQLEQAKTKAYEVKNYLTEIGFAEPLIAMSGNGYHLLYRVDMENTVQNKKRIKATLQLLSDKFSDDKVTVDTANSNPSRVCKLYGTDAVKGTIHRESTIISVPDRFEINNVDLLVPTIPESTITSVGQISDSPKAPYTQPIFNDWLDERIARFGIPVVSTEIRDNILYYHLAHCVFDEKHNADITRHYNPYTGHYDGVPNYRCYNIHCNHDMDDMWELYGIVKEEPKTVLTYEHLATVCKNNKIDIYWDVMERKLIIDGKFFKTKERSTLVRITPQILKEILFKANYTAITNENIQETIIVLAANNARNTVREVIDKLPIEKTGEFKRLCEIMKLSSQDAFLFEMWLKQAYCMMYNDSDTPYSLDFGLICENKCIEEIMGNIALFDDFHKVCVAPHSEHNFTTKLLTTSWICRINSIPPKRKDWVTGICAAPYVIDTMPYKDVKIQFPHRTSYYSADTELLKISDFWQLLVIPDDIDMNAIKQIDYVKVWSDIITMVKEDYKCGYNSSNCFLIEHKNYGNVSTPHSVEAVINNILNNCPDGYTIKDRYITAENFKNSYQELSSLTVDEIKKQLKDLGYKNDTHKIDGKSKRAYQLPYWTEE